MTDTIREELFSLSDPEYREFQIRLFPTVEPDTVIGVRTPELRAYARRLVKSGDIEGFLRELPHGYFDENQLHAFIVSEIKDYEKCIEELERFLPYVDNWATCDQLSPKALKKRRDGLPAMIQRWIASGETYTVRFGIGMLMRYYLDEEFKPEYLELVSSVRSDEYYVNMMRAWYFATALAKQYEATLPYIELKKLDAWTHNKTIQKAVESFRITPEQKQCLKSLKIK